MIAQVVDYCKHEGIELDFHYTAPPLCILNYPDYNLEYTRLQQLRQDVNNDNINVSNLESFQVLWKEKQKFS